MEKTCSSSLLGSSRICPLSVRQQHIATTENNKYPSFHLSSYWSISKLSNNDAKSQNCR